jgi:AcrR family transcriptional regulator
MAANPNLRKGGAEERILATAAGLFATFGYKGVSTRDIASGAGVNEVTIYRHHPRKRDLYMAVLEAELQQVKLRGDLLARVAEAGDGKMVLARTFELIAATLTYRPELLRLMQFSALELGEDLNPLLRKHLGELVEVIARYVEPWAVDGKQRGANAKGVVLALISIVVNYGSLHRMFLDGRPGTEAMTGAYADFCNILLDKAGPSSSQQEGRPGQGLKPR